MTTSNTPIAFAGQLTEQDVKTGLALVSKAGINFQIIMLGVLWIWALWLAIDQGSYLFLAIATVLLYLLGLNRFSLSQSQVHLFRLDKQRQLPFHGTVTPGTITITGDGFDSILEWHTCRYFKMSDDTVVLVQAAGLLIFFPKRLFASEEDWEAFRRIVREQLPEVPQSYVMAPATSQ